MSEHAIVISVSHDESFNYWLSGLQSDIMSISSWAFYEFNDSAFVDKHPSVIVIFFYSINWEAFLIDLCFI